MFGKNLRRLRKNKKLTMKEFGAKFNLAESTISGYENGNRTPDIEIIERFADFFGVSVDELLGRSETNNESSAPEWATAKDKRDLKKFLESPEVLYFDGVEFTEEDRAKMLGVMEAIFWDAKKRNKEAYRKSREKKNDS